MNVSIEKYSEIQFAVFGDTRCVKESLKEMGGRYNPKLGESARPGWIFVNKSRPEVEAFLNEAKKEVQSGKLKVNSGSDTKTRNTISDPWKKPTSSTEISVSKEMISNLMARIEILETEVAILKRTRANTTSIPTSVPSKTVSSSKDWADYESEEEENEDSDEKTEDQGSFLQSYRKQQTKK